MSKWSDKDKSLLAKLEKTKLSEPVTTKLFTDERVLARISDGIYREPASALRELIANAYDADATRVTIETFAPHFASISVRDDGAGMTLETLVRLINHIGGSSKRQAYGADLGVTSADDPALSPGGRPLIGKIGIGLFSVSQLCRQFQIITKRQNELTRLVATVTLHQYDEDQTEGEGKQVEAGTVSISRVPAADLASHGTDIILLSLTSAARDLLKSSDVWDRVEQGADEDGGDTFSPPTYHVGRTSGDGVTITIDPVLPWNSEDSPERKFESLHASMIEESGERGAKPRLETTFDRYLRTIWQLSLAAPLAYLGDRHPFDHTGEDFPEVFLISNGKRHPPVRHTISPRETIRQHFQLQAPRTGKVGNFEVYIDGVRLRRPIHLDTVREADKVRRPLLFVGKFSPDLTKVATNQAGGRNLEFESYLLWTPRVVPTDHKGVMVRIADASGTLFDESFLGYKTAETTRLSQISSEVYVLKGLDSALNIDRESFNFGHPHAKLLASWLHRALVQVANTQKRISKDVREAQRTKQHAETLADTDAMVSRHLTEFGREEAERIQVLEVSPPELKKLRREGTIALDQAKIFKDLKTKGRGKLQRQRRVELQRKIEALAKLLAGYGLLQHLSYEMQEKLLAAVVKIFEVGGK